MFCCDRCVLSVPKTAPSDFARQTCIHASMVDSFAVHGLRWDHLDRKHAIQNLRDQPVEPKRHQVRGNTFEVSTEHRGTILASLVQPRRLGHLSFRREHAFGSSAGCRVQHRSTSLRSGLLH